METLPDIHGGKAKVKNAQEILVQVSPDLTEKRYVWPISLTATSLGGANNEEDSRLYARLIAAKQSERPVTIHIEFDQFEMDLNQTKMFDADGNPISAESPDTEGVAQAVAGSQTTAEGWENGEYTGPPADDARRTYKINGEEHEYTQASTEPELATPEEEDKELAEAAADGAPEEFQKPSSNRRRRGGAAAAE